MRSVGSLDIDPDGTTPPERVLHQGEDVSKPGWESDGRLRHRHGERTWLIIPGSQGATPEVRTDPDQLGVTSPDGRWRAREMDVPRAGRDTPDFSEFERRHEARFRGEALDWYPFKRDGGDFPLENPSQIPAREVFLESLTDDRDPVQLTDLEAGSPMWSPDGMHLYFTTGIGGATRLFRMPARGGPVEQVTTGERRISDVHADFLEEVTLATHPTIAVHWSSYDGTPIEGFLIFPYDYDPQAGSYPLIIMNHGGPHSASGYGEAFKWGTCAAAPFPWAASEGKLRPG